MTDSERGAMVRSMLYNTPDMNAEFNPRAQSHLESVGSPNKMLRFDVEEARLWDEEVQVDKNLKDAAARAEQVQVQQIKEDFDAPQARAKKK